MLLGALLLGSPGQLRADHGVPPPFAEVVDGARLIIRARVLGAPPEEPAYRLGVTAVFKGSAGPILIVPVDQQSVELRAGADVVLAMMDPRVVDFRGTTVLTIAADGSIATDYIADAPPTVGALYAWFGLAWDPTPDASVAPEPVPTPTASLSGNPATSDCGSISPLAALFVAAGVAGFALWVIRRRSRPSAR